MSFFSGIKDFVGHMKDAVVAGNDFNPLLSEVMDEIESLHSQGKLDDVIYSAEQAYEKEHGAYASKGTHTNAADSKNDIATLAHFMQALANADGLPQDLRDKAQKLADMKDAMNKALGPLANLL